LSDCRIGSTGALAVASALKYNKSLEFLHMSGANCDIKAVMEIGDALQVNCTLRGLNLSSCKINDDGIVYMTDALKKNIVNTNIRYIDLEDNPISADKIEALKRLIRVSLVTYGTMRDKNRNSMRTESAPLKQNVEYLRNAMAFKEEMRYST
jgi:Ran GTPase-activating protein (RanGAP) involved in mRNA processing and transport